jgi:protein-disulfide isomerase
MIYHSLLRAGAMALALCALSASSLTAAPTKSFSDTQRSDIELIVHDYLVKHPEVLVEAMNELQAKEDAASKSRVADILKSKPNEVYNDGYSFVAGNPKSQITLVEFFDYNCGYCRKAYEKMMALAAPTSKVRFIFKEYPILTPESETASKAAMAAARQGKYLEFHRGLMSYPGKVNDHAIDDVATKIGLDVNRMHKDMKDPKIAAQIDANHKIAEKLNIDGTPSFIIGDQLLGGWSESELNDLINGKKS